MAYKEFVFSPTGRVEKCADIFMAELSNDVEVVDLSSHGFVAADVGVYHPKM